MKTDRKSVKRNITSLLEMGYPIEFTETLRMYPNKEGEMEESYILSDFYLEREFTDAELRLLIDSPLFSEHIPYSQCKELVRRLEGLSNRYFKSRVKYITTLPETAPKNPWFGTEIAFSDETEDEVAARGTVNWHTMRHWALQYCRHVRVLAPADLAQMVREDLESARRNYEM